MPDSTSSPPTVDQATSILQAVNPADAASLTALDGIYETESGAMAAVAVLAAAPSGAPLFAALDVYRSAGADPTPLRALFTHAIPSVRVLAAAGALEKGDVSGFAPLIAALDIDDVISYSSPPCRIWVRAMRALVLATGMTTLGPPYDATATQRAAAKTAWSQWLATHQAGLAFDASTGEWNVP